MSRKVDVCIKRSVKQKLALSIATVLTDGNSVAKISTFGNETGLTQVMIAIDPSKFQDASITDSIVDAIVTDVSSSQPEREDGEVRCPGMGGHLIRRDNLENGIPVEEENGMKCLTASHIMRKGCQWMPMI